MRPQRRDLAYNAYLKEHPDGNFARFTQLSVAGKIRFGDPTLPGAAARSRGPTVTPLGSPQPLARVGSDKTPGSRTGDRELRRKIAWAVGSTYSVPYTAYNTWPADYARRAADRLIEIHGRP